MQSATTVPTVTTPASPAVNARLLDYLGVLPDATDNVNALPVRSYNKIYNTFYRDQDLDSEVSQDDLNVLNVNWARDYFTACRPTAYEGTGVTIPIGGTADVVTNSQVPSFTGAGITNGDFKIGTIGASPDAEITGTSTTTGTLTFGDESGLEADLSTA